MERNEIDIYLNSFQEWLKDIEEEKEEPVNDDLLKAFETVTGFSTSSLLCHIFKGFVAGMDRGADVIIKTEKLIKEM